MGCAGSARPGCPPEDGNAARPRHPPSGEIMCGRCGRSRMYGTVRSGGRTYPDGEPRREYRCRARQDWPEALRGCGRNNIDARVAEEAVSAAMMARLNDPRRAERRGASGAGTGGAVADIG
jgi:hypothetical protein